MVEKLIMRINGNKNSICLNSSYKLTLKKIRRKTIIIDDKIREPKMTCRSGLENIFFSIKGNKSNPIIVKTGSLKNNQIKI